MNTLLKSSLATVGAVALAGPAAAQPEERASGVKLTATLTGAAEVPGPGDPNGAGLFEGRVNPGLGRICYSLSAGVDVRRGGIADVAGAAGVAGDPVLTLDTPDGDDEDSEECQDIDRSLAQALIQDPADYYVNVHTGDFPDGAIRGQLSR